MTVPRNRCELVSPSDEESWAAYHRIRRTVLFENRGIFGEYDPNRPDDRKPGHFPQVLVYRREYIGVVRIDMADEIAFLRRVAIDEPWQRKGFGRELIRLAEEFARARGARHVESDVAVDAVAFYAKCGYRVVMPSQPGASNLHVTKTIAAPAGRVRVGLIGDYDPTVPAHEAIPLALRLAGEALALSVELEWVPTTEIRHASRVAGFDGLWCVPASPYRSMDGALLAIRFAREHGRPFLGTCGGFQHATIEYARNVLGWADAEHAETAPDAVRPVIALLACALVDTTDSVELRPGSRIAAAYGRDRATEGYRCRYGLNPRFQAALVSGPLRASAHDDSGEIRAVELDGHPFFVATLFQPERAALKGQLPPLVAALVRASATQARGRAS